MQKKGGNYSPPWDKTHHFFFLGLVLSVGIEEIRNFPIETRFDFQTATYKLVLLTAISLVWVGVTSQIYVLKTYIFYFNLISLTTATATATALHCRCH